MDSQSIQLIQEHKATISPTRAIQGSKPLSVIYLMAGEYIFKISNTLLLIILMLMDGFLGGHTVNQVFNNGLTYTNLKIISYRTVNFYMPPHLVQGGMPLN